SRHCREWNEIHPHSRGPVETAPRCLYPRLCTHLLHGPHGRGHAGDPRRSPLYVRYHALFSVGDNGKPSPIERITRVVRGGVHARRNVGLRRTWALGGSTRVVRRLPVARADAADA